MTIPHGACGASENVVEPLSGIRAARFTSAQITFRRRRTARYSASKLQCPLRVYCSLGMRLFRRCRAYLRSHLDALADPGNGARRRIDQHGACGVHGRLSYWVCSRWAFWRDGLSPSQALRMFAIIETVIGALALLLPLELAAAGPLLANAYADGQPGVMFNVLRVGLSLLLLAAPAAGMGATFPLASRWMVPSASHAARRCRSIVCSEYDWGNRRCTHGWLCLAARTWTETHDSDRRTAQSKFCGACDSGSKSIEFQNRQQHESTFGREGNRLNRFSRRSRGV